MNGTPLGFWQKNPILRNVITPQYTLPHPRDIHRIIAYIKGLQSVKWHYFPTDIHTPNKVTLNTRKSILNTIQCHFSSNYTIRKSLDRLKSLNLLRLIFFVSICSNNLSQISVSTLYKISSRQLFSGLYTKAVCTLSPFLYFPLSYLT